MDTSWIGVFAIPPTPFGADGECDIESLRRCVRFCLKCGVHGLVTPVNASEFMYLNIEERYRVAETVLKETQGKVPVVIGVTAICERFAVELAKHAQDCGADAVIAMPPHIQQATILETNAYYEAIDRAVQIPIFLQNYGGPGRDTDGRTIYG